MPATAAIATLTSCMDAAPDEKVAMAAVVLLAGILYEPVAEVRLAAILELDAVPTEVCAVIVMVSL